jgi:hypothetical protein
MAYIKPFLFRRWGCATVTFVVGRFTQDQTVQIWKAVDR